MFLCRECATLILFNITSFMSTLFPSCRFENIVSLEFCSMIPKKLSFGTPHLKNYQIHILMPQKAHLCIITFILSWGMHI